MTISTKEAAKILGLSDFQVLGLVKKGQIPTVNKAKKGSKRVNFRYDEAEIRFLAPNFKKGAQLIQDRVEAKLAESPKPVKRISSKSRLERIESKLDKLLEILS